MSNPIGRSSRSASAGGASPGGGPLGGGGGGLGGLGGLGKAGGVMGIIVALLIAFMATRGGGGGGVPGPTGPAPGDAIGERTSLVTQDKTTRSDLSRAEEDDLDGFVESAVDDLVEYWTVAYPAVYDEPYQPLADVFPYSPSAGTPISCGGRLQPQQLSNNAIYCSAGDYVTWDADSLFPNFYANFGKAAVGVVLAHEWGHAMQQRADLSRSVRPIIRELMADCFAGAWIRRGVDGTGEFELSPADVDAAIAGFLLLRDPPGAPIDGQQAHGSAFDRMNAFREGVELGEEHCATYPTQGPRIVDLVLESGEANSGNLPYDVAVKAVLDDLDAYWLAAFEELGFRSTPSADPFTGTSSCPDSDTADQLLAYCESTGGISWSEPALQDLQASTGDFATGLLLARLYGEALVAETGATDPLGLVADCLAGVWAGDVAYTSQRPLEFSAGDLDEGMSALLRDPDGSDAITFDRVAAFENGFFEGDQGTLDSVELCGG